MFSHMAKNSEPWEHKLGGLANKGETQFHADDDNDNSDDNITVMIMMMTITTMVMLLKMMMMMMMMMMKRQVGKESVAG